MATVMRHELVLQRQWLDDDDFMAEMSLATLVPGAIAVNVAYLQGRRLRGKVGAATAVFGTVLPAFGLILLVAWVALPYFSHPQVAAFLRGLCDRCGWATGLCGLYFWPPPPAQLAECRGLCRGAGDCRRVAVASGGSGCWLRGIGLSAVQNRADPLTRCKSLTNFSSFRSPRLSL